MAYAAAVGLVIMLGVAVATAAAPRRGAAEPDSAAPNVTEPWEDVPPFAFPVFLAGDASGIDVIVLPWPDARDIRLQVTNNSAEPLFFRQPAWADMEEDGTWQRTATGTRSGHAFLQPGVHSIMRVNWSPGSRLRMGPMRLVLQVQHGDRLGEMHLDYTVLPFMGQQHTPGPMPATLYVPPHSITMGGAELLLTNESDRALIFSNRFALYRQRNGEWARINLQPNRLMPAPVFRYEVLHPNQQTTLPVRWSTGVTQTDQQFRITKMLYDKADLTLFGEVSAYFAGIYWPPGGD